VSAQSQKRRVGGRKLFQIVGDATENLEKLQALNPVRTKRTVSRLVLEDLRERAGVLKHRREYKCAGCE